MRTQKEKRCGSSAPTFAVMLKGLNVSPRLLHRPLLVPIVLMNRDASED